LQDEYISTGSLVWHPSIQNAPISGYIPEEINSASATYVKAALPPSPYVPSDISSVDTSQLMVTFVLKAEQFFFVNFKWF